MVLIRAIAPVILLLVAVIGFTPEVDAHKNHQKAAAEETARTSPSAPGTTSPPDGQRAEIHAGTPSGTFVERLISWVGRLHPFAVHFPIALFPVALVALVVARRRGESVGLIRSLVIAAGAAAALAGLLGWMSGGFVLVDPDPIQTWHRWIGTILAVAGATIAVWVWRRRTSVNGPGMVLALAFVTLALLVQGWLGAALVHGIDHMSF